MHRSSDTGSDEVLELKPLLNFSSEMVHVEDHVSRSGEPVFDVGSDSPGITSKCAVVFSRVAGVDKLEYLRAAGVVVGASQLHSVIFRESMVKIYFKDPRCAQKLISDGFCIRGSLIRPDSADETDTKVVLKEVDSDIGNDVLERALQRFGKLSSKIIDLTFSDSEYSRVCTGDKKVYVRLKPDITIPDVLYVKRDNEAYKIAIRVERETAATRRKKWNVNECQSAGQSSSSTTKERRSSGTHVPQKGTKRKPDFKKSTPDKIPCKSPARSERHVVSNGVENDENSGDPTGLRIASVHSLNSNSDSFDGHNAEGPDAHEEQMMDENHEPLLYEDVNQNYALTGEEKERFIRESNQRPLSLDRLEAFINATKNQKIGTVRKLASEFLRSDSEASLINLSEELHIYHRSCDNNIKQRVKRLKSNLVDKHRLNSEQ